MTTEIATEKLIVHCEKCGYEWSVGWLPMPTESVVVLLKAARCPRGHHRKFLQIGPTPKPTAEGDPIAWLTNGDTGTSSKTIWSVMMGRRMGGPDWHPFYPSDPSLQRVSVWDGYLLGSLHRRGAQLIASCLAWPRCCHSHAHGVNLERVPVAVCGLDSDLVGRAQDSAAWRSIGT